MKYLFIILFLSSLSYAGPKDYIFPDDAHIKLGQIAASKKLDKDKLKEVRDTVCDGKTPRFTPKYSFSYHPVNTTGMALDLSAKEKRENLLYARKYFKEMLLYESSGHSFTFGYFEVGQKERDEELNHLYTPTFTDMSLLINTFTFRIPLNKIAELRGEKNPSNGTYDGNSDVQYVGYDPDTGEFSADKAIENRYFLWKLVLKNSTAVSEVPKDDMITEFTLELDLSLFCQFSINGLELLSNN